MKLINITGFDVLIFYGLLFTGLGFVFAITSDNDVIWTASLGFVLIFLDLVFFTSVLIYTKIKQRKDDKPIYHKENKSECQHSWTSCEEGIYDVKMSCWKCGAIKYD